MGLYIITVMQHNGFVYICVVMQISDFNQKLSWGNVLMAGLICFVT